MDLEQQRCSVLASHQGREPLPRDGAPAGGEMKVEPQRVELG
jgi:hypothetical protein